MSLACATPLSVISRNSAGTSIFGISYFGRPNASLICFAVLAVVAPVVVSFMTLILKGRFWLDLLTPPSTPEVGRNDSTEAGPLEPASPSMRQAGRRQRSLAGECCASLPHRLGSATRGRGWVADP